MTLSDTNRKARALLSAADTTEPIAFHKLRTLIKNADSSLFKYSHDALGHYYGNQNLATTFIPASH